MNRWNLRAPVRRSHIATAASTLFLLPAWSCLAAGPGPIAAEFQVNTVTTNTQQNPAIAIDADGDFVVAWESNASGSYEIRAQRYNSAGQAQGAEFQVNTLTANNQQRPSIAMDADGDFVIAWDSDIAGNFEIRAQRYNAAGVAQGAEVQVNVTTTGTQTNPSIALDADGDFVVAWESAPSGNFDIFARRFNAAGVAQGGEFQVNFATLNAQRNPVVALDADGDFVIAWDSLVSPSNSYEIMARRYNAAGVTQGIEFQVNTVSTSDQRFPGIAIAANGAFVAVWRSSATGASEIRAQRYSTAGLPQGGEISVTTGADTGNFNPAVASDASGDFVVTWTNDSSTGISARRYTATGIAQGVEFNVNTVIPNNPDRSAVGLDADGDLVVVWQNNIAASIDIRAQRFQGPESVDVSLFQTDSADPTPANATMSYTLSAGNLEAPAVLTGIAAIDNALGSATGLRVIETLPEGSAIVRVEASNWACGASGGRVTCNYTLPLLAGDEASPIILTLTSANTPGALASNVARAGANQFDANLLNNREVERTQLVCAESLIELSVSDYSVTENLASAIINASRSGGVCGAATVQFDTTGSSAAPGLDFTDVTGTLSWADGESGSKTFNIPIINDTLDEIDERLMIALSSVRGASLGTRTAARLTIVDNDLSPRVNFTASAQASQEVGGLVRVTAQLGSLSGREVSIPLSFAGTASNGSDYFPATTSITIPAGQLEASASIEIASDEIDEADETIIVGMASVSGATPGSLNAHTITITDDDVSTGPSVSFDSTSASQNEATSSIVRVQLSAASAQTVTVPYSITGNAKLGIDYSLSLPSPIVFNPGEVEKTITIAPLDDNKDESDENAVLTLVTPTNATLGAVIAHTRTIVDNDP